MTMQFRVNTLNLWSCPIKHNDHKKQNSRHPETGIIYERRHINIFQKVQRIVLTDGNFSSLFINHLEVHSRRYMILRNRRAYSFSNIKTGVLVDRHCRCLTKKSPRVTARCLDKSRIENLLSFSAC